MSMKATPKTCAGCTKPLPPKEYLRCAKCKAAYDLECAGVNCKQFYNLYLVNKQRKGSWICPECVCNQPKLGNTNTPVRSIVDPEDVHPSPLSDPTVDYNVTHRTKHNRSLADDKDNSNVTVYGETETPENPLGELKLFWSEMRAFRIEINHFRTAIADVTASITAQSDRMDKLETRVDTLESKIGETHHSEVSTLELTISQLKAEIRERDQDMLSNDVEIAGFPEIANENGTHIILAISRKLGVGLDECDVVSAERVGPARAMRVDGGGPARPRPLAVRLLRRAQRDALLQAARVRRSLNTDDMNLPGVTCTLYINERLTRPNRQLFQKTREIAKRFNWKYVWTRDGKIFSRQENGKARHRLRSDLDLAKVFGSDAIGADAGSIAG